MTKVGDGQYRYQMVENWAHLPDDLKFGVVTGVAVDSQDRVYICQQRQAPPVIVFTRDGVYLNSWGTDYIVEPHTIFIGPDDIMYLADRGAHVGLKLTLDGKRLLELGVRGHPSNTGCTEDEGEVLRAGSPFNRPTRMLPSSWGDLYVSDGYRNSRIHTFSPTGALLSSWGAPGKSAPGEFHVPHSLCLDKDGLVYVCDRRNNRIQIFSPQGVFLTQWTDVNLPTDIYIDDSETIYVIERPNNDRSVSQLSVRNKAGVVLASWQTPRSHQLWVDSHGDIYLATGGLRVGSAKAVIKCLRDF